MIRNEYMPITAMLKIKFFGATKFYAQKLKLCKQNFEQYHLQNAAVPGHQLEGTWVYQTIGEVLETVGLYEIGVYITCRQNMVSQYITTCPIMKLCLAAERRPGM